MPELGFHVVFRLADDRPIATTPEERRVLARALLEGGREHGLFVFGAADTHAHAGVDCDRASAGRFAQRVARALHERLDLPIPFERARIRPFEDQRHRANTVGYQIGQAEHHGVRTEGMLEATSLPDMLGMRPLGRDLAERVRRLLPRLDPEALCVRFGMTVPTERLDPVGLREAALAAALLPVLTGRTPEALAARVAAVAAGASLPTSRLAEALGLPRRTVADLRRMPADAALVRAIRLQMGQRVPDLAREPDAPYEIAAIARARFSRAAAS